MQLHLRRAKNQYLYSFWCINYINFFKTCLHEKTNKESDKPQ